MAKRGQFKFCGFRIDIMAAVFTLLVTWAFTGSIVVRAIYRLTHGTYHVNADVMLGVAVSSPAPSPRTPQTPTPFPASLRLRSHSGAHAGYARNAALSYADACVARRLLVRLAWRGVGT